RCVYVADGATASVLAFRIDAGTGKLSQVGRYRIGNVSPGGYGHAPGGMAASDRFLFVIIASTSTGHTEATWFFEIDRSTGALDSRGEFSEENEPGPEAVVTRRSGPVYLFTWDDHGPLVRTLRFT